MKLSKLLSFSDRAEHWQGLKKNQDAQALGLPASKYQNILDDLEEFVVRWEPGTGIRTYVNQAYCNYFQLSREEAIGTSFFDLVEPSDLPRVKEKLNKITPETPILTDIHRVVSRKDQPVWQEWTDRGIFSEDGRLIEMQSVGRDVTKTQEEQERLRQREENLRRTFEFAPIGIAMANQEGKLYYVNLRFANIVGYTRDEIQSMTIEELTHPEDRPKIPAQLRQVLEKMKPSIQLKKRYLHKDGHTVWAQVSISPILKENGDFAHTVAIIEDITNKVETENQRKKWEERLRQAQKMEAVGTLAGGIAHDFNNILSALIGFTETAMRREPSDTVIKSSLQKIYQAEMRAKDLVQQILTYSRDHEPTKERVDFNMIVDEVVDFLKSSMLRSVEINKQSSQCAPVLADLTQIYQLVMNLCTNAQQAVQNQKDQGVITVRTFNYTCEKEQPLNIGVLRPGSYSVVSVADNGEGIPTEKLQRIFDPFYSTKEVGQGVGLGLSVVSGIVRSHKGALEVTSELGRGTTFTVYLPSIEGSEPSITNEESQNTETNWQGHGEYILVVDDEADLLELHELNLTEFNYKPVVTCSGAEALSELRQHPNRYALLLVDLKMPKLSGVDVIREAQKIAPDIPTILMTGYAEPDWKNELDTVRIDQVLFKPFTLDQLLSAITRTIRKN